MLVVYDAILEDMLGTISKTIEVLDPNVISATTTKIVKALAVQVYTMLVAS